MANLTHEEQWRMNPSTTGIFVSDFVQHSYPILDSNPWIHKVLDVACGNGMGVTLPLLERGLEVHCFDHGSAALDAVRMNVANKGYHVDAKRADMYGRFPYEDVSFDAAFCFQAIFHGRLEQIMSAFREISRVTRVGGFFFGTFLSYERIEKEGGRYFVNSRLPDGRMIRNYQKQDDAEPHLFYCLSSEIEYMQPHYYFTKDELRAVMEQFLADVTLEEIIRKRDSSTIFFAYGSVHG